MAQSAVCGMNGGLLCSQVLRVQFACLSLEQSTCSSKKFTCCTLYEWILSALLEDTSRASLRSNSQDSVSSSHAARCVKMVPCRCADGGDASAQDYSSNGNNCAWVATDSQQRLSHGCWQSLLHLLAMGFFQRAQLTSAGCGSTLPLARMGLTPALHASGAMRPSASLHSPTQRPATSGGPFHRATTSLCKTG